MTLYFNFRAKDNWNKLTSFLSGQFCASISLISPTETVNPKAAFQPFLSNDFTNAIGNQRYGFVASLPQEAVCTENLTPWTKLLPCRNRKGLGNLLTATNIFNSQFISLSLDFRFSCKVKNFLFVCNYCNNNQIFRTLATVPLLRELN